MKREDVIKLAESVGINFQTVEGITGRLTTSTRGSQSIEKLERLIDLATEKAVADALDDCIDIVARRGGSIEIEAAIRARKDNK